MVLLHTASPHVSPPFHLNIDLAVVTIDPNIERLVSQLRFYPVGYAIIESQVKRLGSLVEQIKKLLVVVFHLGPDLLFNLAEFFLYLVLLLWKANSLQNASCL